MFKLQQQATSLTKKVFGKEGKNDESDAFRHFIWSAQLTKELDSKKAKLFLDAHENDSTQSSKEKDMDLSNNSLGIEFVKKRESKGGPLRLDTIESEALKLLKEKRMKVLKPQRKKIPKGYYSN